MIEVKTKLQKWGNSFGVVVPVSLANKEKLKEGEEVSVLVSKKNSNNVLREIFGKHKSKKSTDKIMSEINEELDIDF